MGLIRNRLVRLPGRKNVDRDIVPVSGLLPADREIGQEGNWIGHVPALKLAKGMSLELLLVKYTFRTGEAV